MNAKQVIQHLLLDNNITPATESATCFAPANIALIKYWGKSNTELNLPMTNSLSIALPNKGTTTTIRVNTLPNDRYYLNGVLLDSGNEFSKRLTVFCNFFRFANNLHFDIDTHNNIPTAAGLASSASGFAALVLAFDKLFDWQLDKSMLSILARIGSGSACRSLWDGFVEWQKGAREDGLDSFAFPLDEASNSFLSKFNIGLLIFEKNKKVISSRQAMLNTVNTSPSYKNWPIQVEQDIKAIKHAIACQDFMALGEISERNARAMHATMLDSQPKTDFCTNQTQKYREQIWQLRKAGVSVYFTQDAGPNLKLLFQKESQSMVTEFFPELEVISLDEKQ